MKLEDRVIIDFPANPLLNKKIGTLVGIAYSEIITNWIILLDEPLLIGNRAVVLPESALKYLK